ncbi:MAG: hypothetical protein Q8930_03300 [Bacillota bacterium]|nr:hypothetical protein [Bacillota bacterium]
MKSRMNFKKYLIISFCVLAACVIISVLFKYPQPGVADQGDFDRVMGASGLVLPDQNKNNPDFQRFFNYTVTDYTIKPYTFIGFGITLFSTSMGYLITAIGFLCRILGSDTFKTGYLAAAYAVLYTFALAVIIKNLNSKNKLLMIMLSLLCLFVFFDGNYLVWFNSLYGEPMMLTTLLLYISSLVYYQYHRYVVKSGEKEFRRIVFTFIAAIFFMGSKMQVITALPVIILMQVKIFRENRELLNRRQFRTLIILSFVLVLYPMELHIVNGAINKDIEYNSVFYGILKDSKNPRQDLIDMGLNPDMAVEAGKHSYLDPKEYTKYAPRTEITEKEFYSKMGSGKLVKFYITHPIRLIQGMEYTAEHAFFTGTSLGHFSREYSEKPVREFNRFTYWSELRGELLPKNLAFIAFVFLAVFAVSIYTYIKNRGFQEARDKVYILWIVMFIGLIQFPMPFIGNGQADTTKQLYLFNFVFDIMLVVSVCWCIDRLLKLVSSVGKRNLGNH